MKKTFVLDTNVLLHNPQSIQSFEENFVVLPMAVIEELDKFKTHHDELGRNSRWVIRKLDDLREAGNLRDGVSLQNNVEEGGEAGSLRIITGKGNIGDTEMDTDSPDNRILRVAYNLHTAGENVIFVSKDINVRLKADALGMQVMDYESQKVNFDELFTGYREVSVPQHVVDEFYNTDVLEIEDLNLYPNEFLLLQDETNPKHSALCRAVDGDAVTHLNKKTDHAWNVRSRSKEQRMAIELLLDPEVQLVTLVGQAGTGKTLLAIGAGLEAVLRMRLYEKVLVSRPIIPLGKDIGYLPGAKDEKLTHWMQPIYDNLGFLMRDQGEENDSQDIRKKIDDLHKNHHLELEAITYIRGRSITRQYVIVDEAQNLTPHEVKTIVSRAGEGTKIVLTGDPYQIDNPYLDAASNGLTYTVERLKNQQLHGHITLRKSERSTLAAVAAEHL